jgi:hypothetical protein
LVYQVSQAETQEEIEAMYTKTKSYTLGRLYKIINEIESSSPHFVEQLENFVDKRNWLVHRSRHECHTDMYIPQRRKALVSKINEIADEALELMKSFQASTETHLITQGKTTKEQIDQESEFLLRKWTNTGSSEFSMLQMETKLFKPFSHKDFCLQQPFY